MLEAPTLLYFISVSFLLTIAPGPDIIFLATQALHGGPRAGVATALGLASGNLVHTLAAALGVSVIFQTSPLAFEALKIAGVCYLLYLAYGLVAGKGTASSPAGEVRYLQSSLFIRGVLMNVLNPKVALFFLAFLPQFATADSSPIWLQMMTYGVIFTALVAIVFGSIGLFAGMTRRILSENAARSRWFRWLTAGVYASLAVRLLYA